MARRKQENCFRPLYNLIVRPKNGVDIDEARDGGYDGHRGNARQRRGQLSAAAKRASLGKVDELLDGVVHRQVSHVHLVVVVRLRVVALVGRLVHDLRVDGHDRVVHVDVQVGRHCWWLRRTRCVGGRDGRVRAAARGRRPRDQMTAGPSGDGGEDQPADCRNAVRAVEGPTTVVE